MIYMDSNLSYPIREHFRELNRMFMNVVFVMYNIIMQ